MVYKIEYRNKNDDSVGYIKYGFTEDEEVRFSTYSTYYVMSSCNILKFEQADIVDELCINLYLREILNLKPVNKAGGEIFENPGENKLDIIDSDLSLESFYRHLMDINFSPRISAGSKKSTKLSLRIGVLQPLLSKADSALLERHEILLMSRLMESSMLFNSQKSRNCFSLAEKDSDKMDKLLSKKHTIRGALDYWFNNDFSNFG